MGGWGSGRQSERVSIEGCGSCRLSISDVRDLLHAPTGTARWLQYHRNGQYLMTVVVEMRPDQGYARLQHPSRASERAERMDYTLGLTWTVPRFGGRRWWFSCPISMQRCSVLYLPRGAHKFGSAKAYGLAYDVTRMEEHDRLWRRMEKIARRLGDDDPDPQLPPRKPKRMRTVTYDRLLGSWIEAADRRDAICDAKIAGLLARLDERMPKASARRRGNKAKRDLAFFSKIL
jgi:hypothetical protein